MEACFLFKANYSSPFLEVWGGYWSSLNKISSPWLYSKKNVFSSPFSKWHIHAMIARMQMLPYEHNYQSVYYWVFLLHSTQRRHGVIGGIRAMSMWPYEGFWESYARGTCKGASIHSRELSLLSGAKITFALLHSAAYGNPFPLFDYLHYLASTSCTSGDTTSRAEHATGLMTLVKGVLEKGRHQSWNEKLTKTIASFFVHEKDSKKEENPSSTCPGDYALFIVSAKEAPSILCTFLPYHPTGPYPWCVILWKQRRTMAFPSWFCGKAMSHAPFTLLVGGVYLWGCSAYCYFFLIVVPFTNWSASKNREKQISAVIHVINIQTQYSPQPQRLYLQRHWRAVTFMVWIFCRWRGVD